MIDVAPMPVVFEPLYKAKPWGGRHLETLLGKKLPAGTPIGESWELVDLEENVSRVKGGLAAGVTVGELVSVWGKGLLGDAPLVEGRFPLLVKFLDACEHLSVQVHPKPVADDTAGEQAEIKHECWYILHAEPGAKLYIGLKPGVGPEDVARVANTPAMVEILQAWEGKCGECYYLPSGTLHALGAGLVVAEVQTPSDITYRAYDWDRVGLDGKPRELHVAESLANIRYDVTAEMIRQPASRRRHAFGEATRVVTCERFALDHVRVEDAVSQELDEQEMRVWVVLAGGGWLTGPRFEVAFERGDVVLVPARCYSVHIWVGEGLECLEATIPVD